MVLYLMQLVLFLVILYNNNTQILVHIYVGLKKIADYTHAIL